MAGSKKNPFLGNRYRYRQGYKNYRLDPTGLDIKTKVEAKVAQGEYKYEYCECYCGSSESLLISETDRYGFYYPLVICKRCGLIRANPRMNEESYRHFYCYEYRTVYEESDKQMDEMFDYRIIQGKQRYEYLINSIKLPKGAVVFEIGCDFGTVVSTFVENGYEAYGCDYGLQHIEYGRKKTGVNSLLSGGIEKLREIGKKADLIIMHHVLEHFLNLDKELQNIREIATPTAFIYIAVPGTFWWTKNICSGNIMGLLQNAHTYQFSLDSLRYVMECCGYEFIYGDEEIKTIFKISNIFRDKKNVLGFEFEKVLKYLKDTERKYFPKAYLGKLFESIGIKDTVKKIIKRN